jgi:thiosulfate reductase cytochrome b subunit
MTQTADAAGSRPIKRLHPVPVRVMHWINAIMILIMIGSGFKIYDLQPIFSWVRFPDFLLIGGDPETAFKYNGDAGFGGAVQWHFMAMWFVVVNGLAYLIYGVASGRLRRKMFPIWPREVLDAIREALRFHLSHADITVYNAVQKLLYVGIILVVIVQVMSGLAIWKPVQFSRLAALFHDFQTARLIHFLGMSAICLFLAVHVLLSLLVPRTLVAMVTGGPRVSGPAPKPAAPTVPLPQPGE